MAPFLVLIACTDEPPPELVVATQNAGTTPYLDLVEESSLRKTCEDSYENNLCTLPAEMALADALADDPPDVLFLQEIWHPEWCEGLDADAMVEPFACAGEGHPLDRVLPPGMTWQCSPAYPDNCIATSDRFDADTWTDLGADCSGPGRTALFTGLLDEVPTTLVVVHTNAGFGQDDVDCRVEEFADIEEHLVGLDDVLILGGDVNHDPSVDREDSAAFAQLLDAAGMIRLEDDGPTARLLDQDLDVVATRHALPYGDCTVVFVDAGTSPLMFDHGLLTCR
ncbi:MAG TPA: hypothetical protein QGF58_26785 [Myxococcota bacterium]|nr:hypothetical protein [Myxococcota bacterium]